MIIRSPSLTPLRQDRHCLQRAQPTTSALAAASEVPAATAHLALTVSIVSMTFRRNPEPKGIRNQTGVELFALKTHAVHGVCSDAGERGRRHDDSCGSPVTRLSLPPPTPAERPRGSRPAASLLVARRREVISRTAAPWSLVRTGSPAASSFSFPVGAAVRSRLPPRRRCGSLARAHRSAPRGGPKSRSGAARIRSTQHSAANSLNRR